jgi:hypothetical protein
MADAVHALSGAIGAQINLFEQRFFLVLQISAQSVAAEIGNLHHSGKTAIHKQRCFYDAVNRRPERSFLPEVAH